MGCTSARPGRALLGLCFVTAIVPACYNYAPVAVSPEPATRFALVLNDQGRVGAAPQVGASVARIEGAVVDVTDTAYVVRVAEVRGLFGGRTRWNGEAVTIRREYVSTALQRRFSPGKSLALAVALGGALVAIVASGTLAVFGIGGDNGKTPPDGEQ